MDKGWIAIVGSVDERRRFDPPVRDAAGARAAAELLGAVLARAGFGISVYSLEASFIEADAVRGYVREAPAEARDRVRVILPFGATAGLPSEYQPRAALFHLTVDNNPAWEMSFYRSLATVAGVVLIGGGRSTFVTGVQALTYRKPLLALAAFGGSAEECWRALVAGRDLPDEQEIQLMSRPASHETASGWVAALVQQAVRRREQDKRRLSWSTLATLALVVAWVTALPCGYLLAEVQDGATSPAIASAKGAFLFLLFLAPLVAGASGATIRGLLPESGAPSFRHTVLGVAAGAVASLFYVFAQLMSNPELPNRFVVLGFSVLFGFVGGLTFDVVFGKLRAANALAPTALIPKGH